MFAVDRPNRSSVVTTSVSPASRASSAASNPGEVTTEPPIWDTTKEQLAEADRRIKQLSTYLADTGWDLEGWTQ